MGNLPTFGHLMRRVDSLEKTLMLGGIGGRGRRRWQRMKWLGGITDSMHMSLGELRELMIDRDAGLAVIHGVAESRTLLRDWTELIDVVAVVQSLIHAAARLSYPSLSPRVCSKTCPLNLWCYPTTSPSVTFFSFCLQPFPESGSFLISQPLLRYHIRWPKY